MVDISITDTSIEVLETLNRLYQRMDDTTPVMREVAGILANQVEDAFENEADPTTGEAWEPFSPDYLKRNPRRIGGQMLQDSGQLATSIQTEYSSNYAAVGTNKIYAAIHQFGGTSDMAPAPAAVPARPYLGLSPEGENEVLEVINSYLLD